MLQKNSHFWILFVFSFFRSCSANNTITQNQPLKDGDILISTGNSFALGFFSPGNSTNRYVGIWYSKDPEQTVVWVANRANPINGTHGVLSIDKSGNLVLQDEGRNMLFLSTNVSGKSIANSYFVQLMETGNLVLCEGQENSSIILWESFHYPTDTLLPYMKQGINLTSGLDWSLTSWNSQDDPGNGAFLLKIDVHGLPQFFLYKNSARYWRSGPWNGIQMAGVPDENEHYISTYHYTENYNEVSFFFGLNDPSILSIIRVTESGVIERRVWQQDQRRWIPFVSTPKDLCDYYGHCGSFSNCSPYNLGDFECDCLPGYEPKVESEWKLRDSSHGCRRKPGEPSCGNTSVIAGFIKLTYVKVPDTRNAVANRILGLKECSDLCLKNCSCTGFSSANVSNGGSGCITWYGNLTDIRQYSSTGGQDFYVKVSESERDQYLKHLRGSNRKMKISLAASITGVSLLVLAIWLALWRQRGILRTEEIDKNEDFKAFDLKTISSATNCFAAANKLGEGGFGSVYKGELRDGREVAIKRLSKSSGQGIEEFKNEVTLIARLQHRNLVKLLGYCFQQQEQMLVYEYLPNKGLDHFIFDKAKGASIDWRKRHDIILGIARGMLYLHRDSRLRIIHRDLKASNVLLDANMEPKISDFGMARKFNADQIEGKTRRVVGTYGYMSPEYVMQGRFSEKSDVFSYGVLLLEIISGRRNNSFFGDNIVNLTTNVWELWKEGKALDIVDPAMGDSYNPDEVVRCIHVGLLCVQQQVNDRPIMPEVLSMLCNETTAPLVSPKQPAFAIKMVHCNRNNIPYSPSAMEAFVDAVTITIVEGR